MALNPQNLKRLSSEEARRNGRKGGLASVESRRRRKSLKELLLIALELEHKSGETNAEAIVAKAIQQAIAGDARAREFIRDTIGEKPTDKVDVTTKEKAPEGMAEMYAWLGTLTGGKVLETV